MITNEHTVFLTALVAALAAGGTLTAEPGAGWYLEGPLGEHGDPTWAVLAPEGASASISTRPEGNPELLDKLRVICAVYNDWVIPYVPELAGLFDAGFKLTVDDNAVTLTGPTVDEYRNEFRFDRQRDRVHLQTDRGDNPVVATLGRIATAFRS